MSESSGSPRHTRRFFLQSVSGAMVVAKGSNIHMSSRKTGSHDASFVTTSHRSANSRRLSDVTHELARRALSGEFGRELQSANFSLDPKSILGCSLDKQYALACKLVAEKAPIRIIPGELIVGSATLREATYHMTPVLNLPSTSHTTIGFDRVLKIGYRGLREQILERINRGDFEEVSIQVKSEFCPFNRMQAIQFFPDAPYWFEACANELYDLPPLTVECWVKLHSNTGFNILVANRNKESSAHWEIYTEGGTGFLCAFLPGCKPKELISSYVVTDGNWHHVAMRYTEEKVTLYADGQEVASCDLSQVGSKDYSPGVIRLGGYPFHQLGCDGVLAAVRISKNDDFRMLTSEDVSVLQEDALALWWANFKENTPAFEDMTNLKNSAIVVQKTTGKDFLESMLMCLDAASIWHARYMEELQKLAENSPDESERQYYLRVAKNLERVPENPPRNFYEAVQSLWFMYAFQRLMGNWSGIGRIDQMLGPYLENDLKNGEITIDEAREILAHFWIKGCEWTGAHNFGGTGDAQYYQNIILSGVDETGKDVTNPVTYLVLDIVEELHISDFPIAVRLNSSSPEKLLRRVAEVQRCGGGIVAVYNEETVIKALTRFGYPLEEARRFTNDGCWEVLIPGKTAFIYEPFDALAILHNVLGLHESETPPPNFSDFEELYATYLKKLEEFLDGFHRRADAAWTNGIPAPLLSMFVEDCIEKAKGYYSHGAHYCVLAPHAGGLPNVANSLLVLKKLVFDEKWLTLPEFIAILRNDYSGEEAFRRLILTRFTFYGNDDVEADNMMIRVVEDYVTLVERIRERNGVLRPAGISTFGREIGWRLDGRAASPDGHHKGEILATNCSPSPGTDVQGPTAVIQSYCKLDLTRVPNGATIELKIHPNTVKGEKGIQALTGLLKGFVRLGGFYMHVDVVDSAMLIDAQRHPEKYPNLAVRVAGWSARFATLDKPWQDMIINRTQQYIS